MKVWLVEEIDSLGGNIDTDCKVFDSLEKASAEMERLIDKNSSFIDDVQSMIDDGISDCTIKKTKTYFDAYDGINFDEVLITITELEVL